jgi:hypothetical protein
LRLYTYFRQFFGPFSQRRSTSPSRVSLSRALLVVSIAKRDDLNTSNTLFSPSLRQESTRISARVVGAVFIEDGRSLHGQNLRRGAKQHSSCAFDSWYRRARGGNHAAGNFGFAAALRRRWRLFRSFEMGLGCIGQACEWKFSRTMTSPGLERALHRRHTQTHRQGGFPALHPEVNCKTRDISLPISCSPWNGFPSIFL